MAGRTLHDVALGQRIRKYREANYKNQQAFADALGVSRTTVTAAEGGAIYVKLLDRLKQLVPELSDDIDKAYRERLSDGHLNEDGGQGPQDHSAISTRWLGVIPPSGGRDYVSIDDVRLSLSGSDLEVTFDRLFPFQTDRGRRWAGRGSSYDGSKELKLTFEPVREHGRHHESSGVMMLLRRYDERHRISYYAGKYLRKYESPTGETVDVRDCHLYTTDTFPTTYMPWVAALDLDNTLFDGFSLLAWADSVEASDLPQIAWLREKIVELHDIYKTGKLSHDAFSVEAAMAYVEFSEQNDPARLQNSVSRFATYAYEGGMFFPFAKDMVKTLRDMFIAPVIVTGCPVDLARALGETIGVSDVQGFDGSSDSAAAADASYFSGTADGKIARISKLVEPKHWVLQFAAGDSSSDLRAVNWAPTRAISESLAAESPHLVSPGQKTFVFGATTTGAEISQWLRANVPNRLESLRLADDS